MPETLPAGDATANPAPLGLFGFGLTTVLLNIHNAGFYEMNAMILGLGVFYGGVAQMIAGVMEWRKGNTFATAAFTSYAAFWLSLVTLVLSPRLDPKLAVDSNAWVAYLTLWGILTAGLFVGTLRLSRALQVVFGSLALLFFLLAFGHTRFTTVTINHLIGYEGVFCGLSALYTGMAQVLNETWGRTVLPLGVVRKRLTTAS